MGTVSPSFPLDEWWCSCVSETQGNAASGSLDGSGQGVDAAGGAAEAGCDAAPNQTRTCCRARFSSGLKLTQSISFGRLHGHGSQAAPSSVQDGFTDLRIDRHGSMAGNPFHGAATSTLCRAFDALLRVALTHYFDFDRDLRLYPQLDAAYSLGVEGQSVACELLRRLADSSGCRVHRLARGFSISMLRSWLCYHAVMLASGARLRLLCWCITGHTSCEACHGQGLAGAMLWIVFSHSARLPSQSLVCFALSTLLLARGLLSLPSLSAGRAFAFCAAHGGLTASPLPLRLSLVLPLLAILAPSKTGFRRAFCSYSDVASPYTSLSAAHG